MNVQGDMEEDKRTNQEDEQKQEEEEQQQQNLEGNFDNSDDDARRIEVNHTSSSPSSFVEEAPVAMLQGRGGFSSSSGGSSSACSHSSSSVDAGRSDRSNNNNTGPIVLNDVIPSSVVEDMSLICRREQAPDLVGMNVSSTGTNSSRSTQWSRSTLGSSSSQCESPRRRSSLSCGSSSRVGNGEGEGLLDACGSDPSSSSSSSSEHVGEDSGGELVVSWMSCSSAESAEEDEFSASRECLDETEAHMHVSLVEGNETNKTRTIMMNDACLVEDPYADVRERMEFLAQRDKLLHLGGHTAAQESEKSEGGVNLGGTIQIPFFAATATYLGFAILILVGQVRDFCAFLFQRGRYLKPKTNKTNNNNSNINKDESQVEEFAPLLKVWESLFTRRIFHRTQDCFSRPIASNPGATIKLLERVSWDGNKSMSVLGCVSKDEHAQQLRTTYENGPHFCYTPEFHPLRNSKLNGLAGLSQNNSLSNSLTSTNTNTNNTTHGRLSRECLNLGSYNYLGFADDWQTTCATPVVSSLTNLPPSISSARHEFGTTTLHKRTEQLVSQFLHKEDAIVYNMGFNTNATTIPALLRKTDLILSDELNHTSIINGARASGASIRTFRHNDPTHLEELLRDNIVAGRPRTRRPWGKIVVLVEGVYSMEGEYCNLAPILAVAKKYGAYLYLDEAHSIGACGTTGRGCCEYCGVDPAEVDVLMGTFTKSFGGSGGYVASSRRLISYLRRNCAGSIYHNSISPVVCQQIITSFEVIMGLDGTNLGKHKIQALRDNSNYFRMKLLDMGLHVLGNYDSPIMPVMLYNPAKVPSFSRECLKRGLAVVVVGFPAVPILMSRTRFCISAAHTRVQLDRALREIDEIAGILQIRYAHSAIG